MWIQSVGGSGYQYSYNKINGTVQIFQSAGFTPAGTNAATSLSIAAGTPATYPVGTAANTGSTNLVATAAVTIPISAEAFTGTAVAAAPLVELAAGALPAAILTDLIQFEEEFARQ
jgi:hypothetical protein